MTTALATLFDYAALPAADRVVVERVTTEIRDRMGRAAQNIVEIGERLVSVQERLPGAKFDKWLEAEFGWGRCTAFKMMGVSRKFGSTQCVLTTVAPSALYLLASDSTPAEVREAFVEKAKNGEPVTHSEVKAAVQQAKPVHADPETRQWLDDTDPLLAKHRGQELLEVPARRPAPEAVSATEYRPTAGTAVADDDEPVLAAPLPEEYTRNQPRKLWQQWVSKLHELTNSVTPEEVTRLATGWKSGEREAAATELQDVVDALEIAIDALSNRSPE